MKTIFRFLTLGAFAAVFCAAAATASFAQDECANIEANQALYKKYTDNYAGKLDQVKIAVAAAKDYVAKYEACADKDGKLLYADQVSYLKGALPEREKFVNDTEAKNAKQALLVKFDTAAKSKNLADMYASGKEILAREADFGDVALDVTIALTTAGFDQARADPPVDTYNADTISYAKSAIQKIEAGKTSKSYGVWSYNIKNDKFQDGKSYALGTLNYIIGYVTSFRQSKDNAAKKKEALPYYYKSLQYNSIAKTDPQVYQAVGAWYLDEVIRIDKERTDKIKANDNKDNAETLALLAEQKGYADRVIDAYARAYKLAKDDKNQPATYTDGLYKTFKELYTFRYNNDVSGIDAFVPTAIGKPLPDPSTPITPVKEETPAPTTPTTTPATTTPATKPATTTPTTPPTTTKPTTAPTKPNGSTTPTKPATSTNVNTKTNDAANTKKVTTKKKGTR